MPDVPPVIKTTLPCMFRSAVLGLPDEYHFRRPTMVNPATTLNTVHSSGSQGKRPLMASLTMYTTMVAQLDLDEAGKGVDVERMELEKMWMFQPHKVGNIWQNLSLNVNRED